MQRNDYHCSSYYGGNSRSSTDEYLEHITMLQRMPSMVSDFPNFPNVHEVLNNKNTYLEKHDDRPKRVSHVNHEKHQAPEVHKKVHFVEHEKTSEVDKDGNHEICEDKSIDVEADGFIKQKHKNFGLCKWDTFKVY